MILLHSTPCVPALLAILNEERHEQGEYSREMLEIISWLHAHATGVLQALMKYKKVPRSKPSEREETHWEIVSVVASVRGKRLTIIAKWMLL